MYQFKPYTDRIWNIRQKIRGRVIRGDSERLVLKLEAYEKYKNVVPIIQKPLITLDIYSKITLRIEDDDFFVGNKGKYPLGNGNAEWPLYEKIEELWTFKADGLWHNPEGQEVRLCISQEDIDIIRFSADRIGEFKSKFEDAWLPDGAQEFMDLGASDYLPGRPGTLVSPGHLTPGFPKIINVGYGVIRKQAQDFLDAREGNVMGDDMAKYMFYKSVVLACDAATALIRRYADLAVGKARICTDSVRKAELEKMADGLRHISTEPARNFWEACQAVLLYQLYLMLDNDFPGPSLGRFDQYAWPFLKKDLESGALTEEEGQELCDAFFLKVNSYYDGGLALGKMARVSGIGNTYQHTTIGGVIPETGEGASNPLSYMVLETIGRLRLHDPTVSLRVTKDTPSQLWQCALETAKLVGGLPLFQNDDVIIPGIVKELGFSLGDARDYSLIGCQEIVGSGNDYPAGNGVGAAHTGLFYNIVLIMALNDGINPTTGKQSPVRFGYLYEMDSIETVKAAFEKLSTYLFNWYVTINNYAEYMLAYNRPQTNLSISMEGCMEKGMDCAAGGCKYNSYGGTAVGLATVADSITTIKYMCFDKRLCTTRELYDAVMADWAGYENLRQTVLAEAPHYGNGDPYADEELKWVVDLYYKLCRGASSQRSKVYKAGMYGAADHIMQGELTWATPDGRRFGEPIADAISPAQGRDVNGPTAVFTSAVCFDHSRFMDGMALNLRMHPSVASRDDGIAKLRDMTQAYFDMGGMECQYNVVDTDTLRKAQDEPDSYRDLVVRIAGYSAYFVELGAELQNDIISRNENRI
jgi:formate C-acetyltransferase